MQLLSRRTSAAIDRLTILAKGNQALVTKAIEMYYSGEVQDLVGYIRDESAKLQRASDFRAKPNSDHH